MYVLLVLLTYTTLPFSLGISNTRHRLMCIIRPSSGRAVLQNAVVVHVTSLYPFEGPVCLSVHRGPVSPERDVRETPNMVKVFSVKCVTEAALFT